jgi:hypothetical protein
MQGVVVVADVVGDRSGCPIKHLTQRMLRECGHSCSSEAKIQVGTSLSRPLASARGAMEWEILGRISIPFDP